MGYRVYYYAYDCISLRQEVCLLPLSFCIDSKTLRGLNKQPVQTLNFLGGKHLCCHTCDFTGTGIPPITTIYAKAGTFIDTI